MSDDGAEASLISLRSARRIGLNIRQVAPILLRPLWEGDFHQTSLRARGLFRTSLSPFARWIHFVVVDLPLTSDVRIGLQDRRKLGIGLAHIPPSPADAKASVSVEEAEQQQGVQTAARQRELKVQLGLPHDFFKLERDSDFHKCDMMYPDATREEVDGRITMQARTQTER